MNVNPRLAAALIDGARRGRIEARARTAGTADRELEQLRAARDRLAAEVEQLRGRVDGYRASRQRWMDAAYRDRRYANESEAAVQRVRQMAERWRYTGDRKDGALPELLAALDAPAAPTNVAPSPAPANGTTRSVGTVQGRCPACGGESLFLGDGGYVTCRRLDCQQADAASTLLERPAVLADPSDTERQFLIYALDLAADQMASCSDEFSDEDTAALESLRRLATGPAAPATEETL